MPSAKILAQKQAELDVLVGKLKNAHVQVFLSTIPESLLSRTQSCVRHSANPVLSTRFTKTQ